MSKLKSNILTILISISSFLTILLIFFIGFKFIKTSNSNRSTVQQLVSLSPKPSPINSENLYLSTPRFYSIKYPKSWFLIETYGLDEKNNVLTSWEKITNQQPTNNSENDLVTITISGNLNGRAYPNFVYAGLGPDAPEYSINGYSGYREQIDANGYLDKVSLNNTQGGHMLMLLKIGKNVDVKMAKNAFQSILDSIEFIN